jgi:hypothetical protein
MSFGLRNITFLVLVAKLIMTNYYTFLNQNTRVSHIRQSDGIGDTLFKGSMCVFNAPVGSVFVTAGTALVLVFISVVTVCYICVVA